MAVTHDIAAQNTMQSQHNFHTSSISAAGIFDDLIALNRHKKRIVDYQLHVHYHPYVDALIDTLNNKGLSSMLDVKYLSALHENLSPDKYIAEGSAVTPFPVEEIDVSDDGAYSLYNWELFFHVPMTIAVHLSNNQRFAEAQRWFHYIFDPSSTDKSVDPPQRFWNFLRFRRETKPEFIEDLLLALSKPEDSDLKRRMEKNIRDWREKPFQPHVIARGRYFAYQINVVMKYLDNLIAWGDNLFRQDTIETINEATQLYVLAANILGAKPQKVPPRSKRVAKTYAELKAAGIDQFGNALIEMENEFPYNVFPPTSNQSDETAASALFGIGRSLYFCIPPNDHLLEYWDTVADRLFKIRHCMNFEGVVRQLPLFDPPIDPGMLVKAVAAGLDIGSIVNNINQPLSTVRGALLLQKAQEICTEVKALGGALLSAFEKKESEHLSLLRQQYESNILNLTRDVKFMQWKESEAATEALVRSRSTVFERYRHYKLILGNTASDIDKLKSVDLARKQLSEESFDAVYAEWVGKYGQELQREAYRVESAAGGLMEFLGNAVTSVFNGQLGKTLPLNKNENAELNIFLPTADTFNSVSGAIALATPILAMVPQFNAHGTPIGVGGAVGFGGVQLSDAAKKASKVAKDVADAFTSSADRAGKMANFYRRAEEYVSQANYATSELQRYGRQIISALIREQITKKEYDNHLRKIEQSEAIGTFLNEKFTNEELYSWMKGELSKTYFDCYKLAFDVAKRAEQTMKHELMRKEFDDMNFIKFGYWDSAREGLLAGETLSLDLKRLEMAYHDHNIREYEITRHVELSRLDPMVFLKLKATGSCEITVPEWLYDMDSPGQFMRRIKTVALSIPCVAGPYTGVHCKVSLLRSSIRISSLKGETYSRSTESDDNRFRDFTGAIQSIITSSAQHDSGLFDTNLKDERYLPFEGAGALSTWRIELPNDIPQFDHESITDLVMHIRYTAREAGHLKSDAIAYIKGSVFLDSGLLQLFCLNSDFSTSWDNFAAAAGNTGSLAVTVSGEQLPYRVSQLGTADNLVAAFCCIDWNKNKLVVALNTLTFEGDQSTGWTLSIDDPLDEVFKFLKKHKSSKIYMAVSFDWTAS